jgi:hypothetical protein
MAHFSALDILGLPGALIGGLPDRVKQALALLNDDEGPHLTEVDSQGAGAIG